MKKVLECFTNGFLGLMLILSFVLFVIFMICLLTFPIYVFNEFNVVLSIFSALFCWSGFLGIFFSMNDKFYG